MTEWAFIVIYSNKTGILVPLKSEEEVERNEDIRDSTILMEMDAYYFRSQKTSPTTIYITHCVVWEI